MLWTSYHCWYSGVQVYTVSCASLVVVALIFGIVMMWFSCINVGCSKFNLNTVPQIKLPHFNITSYVNFYMKQSIPNKVSRITEF
jgi:hypothetical protein